MSKIIDAQDILADARNCVECIFLAAADLGDEADPIQVVADIASCEVIDLLREYRESGGATVPAAPDAKPKSSAARTKRKGK